MRKVLQVMNKAGDESILELEVIKDEQKNYWVSTLKQTSDESVIPAEQKDISPKFYGLDLKQAERRMITAIESEYEIIEEKILEA